MRPSMLTAAQDVLARHDRWDDQDAFVRAIRPRGEGVRGDEHMVDVQQTSGRIRIDTVKAADLDQAMRRLAR